MEHRRFLTVTGFETLATGIFMSAQQHFMLDDPHARVVHVVHHLGEPSWTLILSIVGVCAIMAGTCRYSKRAQKWALIALGALWCAYLFAFAVQDFHFRGHIGINTLFTLFIFISILVEAVSDGGGGR